MLSEVVPMLSALFVLLACDDGASEPCGDGLARNDAGDCVEVADADTDTDSDTDSDTDADTDADTDSDSDTDTGPLDADGDGSPAGEDCDDADAARHPGAAEVGWNEVDEDCDGADLHDWIDIAIGCGIDSTGAARCWGDYAEEYGLDVVVPGPFVHVVSGGDYACAISSIGTPTCWGDGVPDLPAGAWADLRDGCGVTQTGGLWSAEANAVGVELPIVGYTKAACGRGYLCAVNAEAGIDCWDLGLGTEEHYGQEIPPDGSFIDVDAEGFSTCALATDGSITCWGLDADGQVRDAPTGTFSKLSVGQQGSCAIGASGAVTCWGLDRSGELAPPAGPFAHVFVEDDLTCGIREGGTAECWGRDYAGLSDLP